MVDIEIVQYLLGPPSVHSGCQLEHRTVRVGPTAVGGSVEITDGIENQASVGPIAVPGVVTEIMQNPPSPVSARLLRQLEHSAAAVRPARVSRAVEITGGIENQVAVRIVPIIRVPVEVMQNRFLLRNAPHGRSEFSTSKNRHHRNPNNSAPHQFSLP